MDDDFVDPLKGIIRAFQRGLTLVVRICRNASRESAAHQLDILEPARGLETSLKGSEEKVRAAYTLSTRALGNQFRNAIVADAILTNRLQALTINFTEQINSLDDYADDPLGFDIGTFNYLRKESERCCDQTLIALRGLHTSMLPSTELNDDRTLLSSRRATKRRSLTQHSPQGSANSNESPVTVSQYSGQHSSQSSPNGMRFLNPSKTPVENIGHDDIPRAFFPADTNFAALPADARTLLSPADSEHSISLPWQDFPVVSARENEMVSPTETRSKAAASKTEPDLIKTDDVLLQVAINDKSLEKRRQSKLLFQEKLKRLSNASSSLSNRDSNATSPSTSAVTSPVTSPSTTTTGMFAIGSIPIAQSSSREGKNSQLRSAAPIEIQNSGKFSSSGSTRSRAGSELVFGPMESPITPKDGTNDALRDFFGLRTELVSRREVTGNGGGGSSMAPPLSPIDSRMRAMSGSPLLSTRRSVSRDDSFETTVAESSDSLGDFDKTSSICPRPSLKLLGLGTDVEDGMEVVPTISRDDSGIMLANESVNGDHATSMPAVSVPSIDYLIKHDASFFQYKEFCDSAKMIARGIGGAIHTFNKTAGMYSVGTIRAAECRSCKHVVDYNLFMSDQKLDNAGIQFVKGIPEVRYRQKLLLKSHLRAERTPYGTMFEFYGCIFCIEAGHTLEEHDATVFFSKEKYFAHIAKHPRPLRAVEGFTVLYNAQPDVVDFDLCFSSMTPSKPAYADLAAKLASMPSAQAVVNHRRGVRGFNERDPKGNPALQYAVGAKIVGIEFPVHFNGVWASGYHDNEKAYFPINTVALEPPRKNDLSTNPNSGLNAVARWDHIRDAKSGWLSFKKKERITHIGFVYQDHWCWSGKNSKNVWGIFPATFVDELRDLGPQGSSIAPGDGTLSPGGISPGSGFTLGMGNRQNSIDSETGVGSLDSWSSRKGVSTSHGRRKFFGLARKNTNASVRSGD